MLLGTLLATSTPQSNVVLEFGAEWCGPCQRISPMIKKLERDGYPIQRVDIDEHRDLANKYGVSSIPCLVLVIDGKMKSKSIYNANDETNSNRVLKQMLDQAQKARLAARQAPKGKPKRLDGGRGSSSGRKSAEIRLVSDQTKEKSGFTFPFGLGGKPIPKATVGTSEPAHAASQGQAVNRKISTVRIRVVDDSGINFGTGTIIESNRDRCTVLSCQHIFRGAGPESKIEVDVFSGSQAQTVSAKLIKANQAADISLLELNTHHRFPVSRIADLSASPRKGDHVFSIGCGGGKNPERHQTRVTGVNRYHGPDTVDCSGSPEQGRSGGGLFNTKGELVGVCFGDQANENRGIYSGLKPIYQLLDSANLSYLHPATAETTPAPPAVANAGATPDQTQTQTLPASGQVASAQPNMNPGNTATTSQLELIKAALEQAGDAEVICIVRPKNSADQQAKVMIINQASQKLMGYLQNDTQQQLKPTIQPAMKHVPNQAQPTGLPNQPAGQPQAFAPISTEPQHPAPAANALPQPITGQLGSPFQSSANTDSPWGNSPFGENLGAQQ